MLHFTIIDLFTFSASTLNREKFCMISFAEAHFSYQKSYQLIGLIQKLTRIAFNLVGE